MPVEAQADLSGYEVRAWPSSERGPAYQLVRCPGCRRGVLLYLFGQRSASEGPTFSIICHDKLSSPRGLPKEIEQAWIAAGSVKLIDHNAYGILLQRALELICRDRRAEGRDLYEMLKDLATYNRLPVRLLDAEESLRALASIGTRAARGDLAVAEIPYLDWLADMLVTALYTVSYYLKKVEDQLSGYEEGRTRR